MQKVMSEVMLINVMPKIHSSLMMDYATGYKLVVLNIMKQHQSPNTSSITCKKRVQKSGKVFHVKKTKEA
jgi:hypothetical protein